MVADKSSDVSAMSFEAALEELESIISRLERGDVPLEESITLYERGTALKTHCDSKLTSAREKIEKIVVSPDGSPTTEPASFS